MTPISASFVPFIHGEREIGSPQPETAMVKLSCAVREKGTRAFPHKLWLKTGYYGIRLITTPKGIIVPLGELDLDKLAAEIIPHDLKEAKSREVDLANLGMVRLMFDPERKIVKVISADGNTTFTLDAPTEDETTADNAEISNDTARSILAIMMLDKKADPNIYRSLRKKGLVLIHVGSSASDLTVRGFILSGKTLSRLALKGYKKDVLYSFGPEFIDSPFYSKKKNKINPADISRFHPVSLLTSSNPDFLAGSNIRL